MCFVFSRRSLEQCACIEAMVVECIICVFFKTIVFANSRSFTEWALAFSNSSIRNFTRSTLLTLVYGKKMFFPLLDDGFLTGTFRSLVSPLCFGTISLQSSSEKSLLLTHDKMLVAVYLMRNFL
ncbi:hypothetical protein GOODEAATRI_030662 [Goodea atripinnis]|uniref:Uncharacterized protein n=1 Tax=Goodea atripinnis TaxID=208336 RepID=A0ABV0MWQ4_9TELE